MTNDPRTFLRDAGYVTVGLGVIAFQKAQVRRRELEAQLSDAGEKTSEKAEQLTTALEDLRKTLEERVSALGTQFGASFEDVQQLVAKVVAEVRSRVPDSAKEAFDTAVGAAKDATGQLLDLVRPNTSAPATTTAAA
jgi:DNA anti-recombination protein RmuC